MLMAAALLVTAGVGVALIGDGKSTASVRHHERAAILESAEWLAARHPGLDHRARSEHVFDGHE
ncbi:hypothetical protein [Gordonia hankookensis]|uniref:Uncharacterized protein n=1 Tax=Gordonia hankookensis TaxID=589403 RepID=A0ABR7WAN4_9ACTN|nr:hypothetical protein [Gordonia hankookensis]MBD1319879.1 hypothetical protein [Gordonia hankookensis]